MLKGKIWMFALLHTIFAEENSALTLPVSRITPPPPGILPTALNKSQQVAEGEESSLAHTTAILRPL